MASNRKRSRSALPSSQRSKRSKIRQHVDVKLPVALDALPWDEVKVPDMFEDGEGFLGLEEVEGVKVIHDGNHVQYLPNTSSKKNSKSKKQLIDSTRDSPVLSSLGGNIFAALEEDDIREECDVTAWEELSLSSEALCAISRLGFPKPTPIQKASIPEILAGYDVVGKASTGSGKTLAFGIPILENWLKEQRSVEPRKVSKSNGPVALILSPTRELAHQLTKHIKALCSGLPDSPHIATVTGGMSIQKQQRQLINSDIIVGTPGRLWEILGTHDSISESLQRIKFLVVDEADRLLTEGHFKEAQQILGVLDRHTNEDDRESASTTRQTLVFSATFDKGLQQKLTANEKQGLMKNAKSTDYLLQKLSLRSEKLRFVDVNPVSQIADGLEESMVECLNTEKDLYLYALLLQHPNQRVLIFTNSIHSVRRLTPLLQNLALPAYALHSQMSQKARLRAVERLSSDSSDPLQISHSSKLSHSMPASILVATDVAARGLDIPAVRVIHYHLPRTADSYVHRSGRSARASASGSSILLCAPGEVAATRRLVARVRSVVRSLPVDRKFASSLKRRVMLAKGIADNALALDKKRHDDNWARNAAADLGVDYDTDEFGKSNGRGGGSGQKRKEAIATAMTDRELGAMKMELAALLGQNINVSLAF